VNTSYLPAGLPAPADDDGVAAPYWAGLRDGVLRVQRCAACGTWQFGAENGSVPPLPRLGPGLGRGAAAGRIYSWERVWHPVHPALKDHGPYLAVVVDLPQAGGLRMVGNLLGDPLQPVLIGADVVGVFEPHAGGDGQAPYGLLQWRLA
jgi:uncharacterized OB-fold protein